MITVTLTLPLKAGVLDGFKPARRRETDWTYNEPARFSSYQSSAPGRYDEKVVLIEQWDNPKVCEDYIS
jgi:hypothetical protein